MASERPKYSVGTPCYALYCGPRRDKDPRWVPAVIVKRLGARTVNVRVFPKGPTWKRHIEQLRPRFASVEDEEISEPPLECSAEIEDVLQADSHRGSEGSVETDVSTRHTTRNEVSAATKRKNPRLPTRDEYGAHNPRRSARTRKPPQRLDL